LRDAALEILTRRSVDEAHVACVARAADDRELFRRSTATVPAVPVSRTLLGPHVEVLRAAGEECVRTAAAAELLEERHLSKDVHGVL
jgi:hypothetical protein